MTEPPGARSRTHASARARWRSLVLRGLTALLIILIGAIGWTGFKLWRSWNSVETIAYDPTAARERLENPDSTAPTTLPREPGDEPGVEGEPPPPEFVLGEAVRIPDDVNGSYLVVGTDNRPGFGGDRADVILLFILPEGDGPPVLLSLPRDLYLPNPCSNSYSRINANLNGCGDVNGPELLTIAVEDYTGLTIDHFALFDFEGFKEIIDEVGGVEICVDHPVRDTNAELRLDAGCHDANGTDALAWVRSRGTLEFVNGRWRTMPGVNDLTRNQRQQDLLLQMLDRLKDFSSLGELTDVVQSLANAFAVDERLSLTDAASLAWSVRSLTAEEIVRLQIPVRGHRTSGGAEVLLPTSEFIDVLTEAYPELGA